MFVMTALDAREQALEMHEELRAAMRRALELARSVLSGGDFDEDALRDSAVDLILAVRRHAAVENDCLEPALRGLDAWGAIRCERLHAFHAEEEETVLQPDGPGGQAFAAPEDLAEAVCSAVTQLLQVLRREEHELLDPEELNDEIVATEQMSG